MTTLLVSPANRQEFFLLKELFNKMQIDYKTLSNNIENEVDLENFYDFSINNLSRAFSNDEPEYTSNMLKEPNPNYNIILEKNHE